MRKELIRGARGTHAGGEMGGLLRRWVGRFDTVHNLYCPNGIPFYSFSLNLYPHTSESGGKSFIFIYFCTYGFPN